MSIALNIKELPALAVNTTLPILQGLATVGGYGVDDEDKVLENVAPSSLKLFQKMPVVPYDTDLIPWNKNPIDRNDVARPNANDALITNRNKLRSLLNIFLFPTTNPKFHKDVMFFVSKIGNSVYFLDGPLEDAPGPKPTDTKKAYGTPFEVLLTDNPNKNLESYYLFQSYRLLGATSLVVRTEVDYVQDGKVGEIKSKALSRFSVWKNSDYFKNIWAQMLFGGTEELVIGVHAPHKDSTEDKPIVTFNNIQKRSFEEVAKYAQMDNPENSMPPLGQLVMLLEWIKANVADKESKAFTYSRATGVVSLG